MTAKRILLMTLLLLLPLSVFAQSADEELIAAAKKGDVVAVKAALEKGAKVNARTNYGATPLHFAADRGHLEVIKALVEAGADTNAKDDFYKMTPIAMALTHGKKEAVELLQKISVEKKNAELATKPSAAASATQSAQPDQTAKPAANPALPALNDALINASKRGELANVKELLAKGADVNAKTRYSQTPLMLAAQQGHTEVVKVLLEAKADLDVVDSFYKSVTALSASAEAGHTEIVKLLLEKGAKGKDNALIGAAIEGRRPVVEHLLKLGGLNQQILDTAFARATENEQKEIAELLKTAGAKLPEKKSLKPEIKIEEATLQKYAGSYRLDEARQFTFIVKDGKLGGWDVRQFSYALTAVEKNVFRIGNDDSRTITFNEESGRIASITVLQNGFKQAYNRVEGK